MRTQYDIDGCDLDAPTTTVDVMLETERKTLPPPPLPGAAAPLAQLEAEVEAFKAVRAFGAWLADRQLRRLTRSAILAGTARTVLLAINPIERAWPAPEKKISIEN